MITLQVNGLNHGGWKTANVFSSIETLSGSFSLTVTDKWDLGIGIHIKPGDLCKLMINQEQVIQGYVDSVEVSYDASNHAITVNGRDTTADLIDCSVIVKTGEWKNSKLENIIKDICSPFGIAVTADVDTGPVIPVFSIEQGMTCLEAIQKLCNAKALLALSDGIGGLYITRAGAQVSPTALIQGQNILSATANYDVTERFQTYIVKGQQQGLDNLDSKSVTAVKSQVTDNNIARYRPLLIIADGQTNQKKAESQAKWEASTRQGRSRTYTIVVQGWVDGIGKIWKKNQLVLLNSQAIGVNDKLLIASVNFRLDESGQLTELSLLPKEAYEILQEPLIEQKEPSKKKGSGSVVENPYITG